MNHYSWIAIGALILVGIGVFGMLSVLPRPDRYVEQEKRVSVNGNVTIDAP